MNRRKTLSLIIVSIFAWTALLGADLVAAETRGNLLGDFFIANQTAAGSFKNSNLDEPIVDEVTEYSTYASLKALEDLGRLEEIGQTIAAEYSAAQLGLANSSKNIAIFYYSSVSYKIANGSLNLVDEYVSYFASLLELQNSSSHGFQSGIADYATVSDTYFAVASLAEVGLLGNLSNIEDVAAYIMSCWVPSQGFGGYENANEANLIDTFFALHTLNILDRMLLTTDQESAIENMMVDHYIADTEYPLHVGSYGIPRSIPFGDISTTYYCVSISDLLSLELHEETLVWLLKRQSGENYGFQNVNEDGTTTASSAILSHYALSSILILDEEGLEGALTEDNWQLKTPIGAIIGIVVGIVGVIAIIILLIWRYKTKI